MQESLKRQKIGKSQSIGDQIASAEEIKARRNISTIETFMESRSAKQPGRPEFNRMLEEVSRRHDIKGIIVWKINRLSRNPVDEGAIRWLLQSGEIDEIITPEKVYTQVDSDFIMAIEGAQAQRFINDLRKDTARGIKGKLDKGMAPRLAPPGYKNSTEKKQGERDIQPHLVYFPLMRKLFDLALTGLYSVQQLWDKASELGIRSSRGKIISRTQLYKALRDPFYTGTRYIHAGRLYTNGIHKQMITDAEFDLIQANLSKRTHPRGSVHKDLLSGTMTCGECGRGITTRVKTKKYKSGKTQAFTYYGCSRKWRVDKCEQSPIRAEELEKQIAKYLKTVELPPKITEWGIKWLKTINKTQAEVSEAKLKAVRQAFDETNTKINRLIDLMISGVVNNEEGSVRKRMLEEDKTKLFENMTKIDEHSNEWSTLAIKTFEFVGTAKDKFKNGTTDQRRTILKLLGEELTIKDKTLHIKFRTPFRYIEEFATKPGGVKHTSKGSSIVPYRTHIYLFLYCLILG